MLRHSITPAGAFGYIAALAAIVSALLKLAGLRWFAHHPDWDMVVRMLWLLMFLSALVTSMVLASGQTTDFRKLVSTGMKAASVYGLMVSAFTWLYYKYADPGYLQSKADRIVEAARANNPEDIEMIQRNAEAIFSAFTHTTLTLVGSLIIGFFYTLIIALLLVKFRSRP